MATVQLVKAYLLGVILSGMILGTIDACRDKNSFPINEMVILMLAWPIVVCIAAVVAFIYTPYAVARKITKEIRSL